MYVYTYIYIYTYTYVSYTHTSSTLQHTQTHTRACQQIGQRRAQRPLMRLCQAISHHLIERGSWMSCMSSISLVFVCVEGAHAYRLA